MRCLGGLAGALLCAGALAFEVPTLEKTVTSQSPGTGTMSVYRMHTGPHNCINTENPGVCNHEAKRGESCYQFECAETVVCRATGDDTPISKCPLEASSWEGHIVKAISMACECTAKVTCEHGQKFAPCAKSPAPTCAHPFPANTQECNRGCRCPDNEYWDPSTVSCVTYDQCPSTHRIEFVSSIYQMGKYPYIEEGGHRLTANSLTDCEGKCLANPECKYGTYVNANSTGQNNECWLSSTTHSEQTLCGVACSSFQKVQGKEVATRIASPSKKGTWQIGEPIEFCECDPATHPSTFTICEQSTFGYEIKVTHLAPKFHTTPYKVGTQHICKMVAEGDCACCSCHKDHANALDIKGIGIGLHTAIAPFLPNGVGDSNLKADLLACEKQCSDEPLCKAGTWITSGYDKGECWLSEHVSSEPEVCEKPCSSFAKIEPTAVSSP